MARNIKILLFLACLPIALPQLCRAPKPCSCVTDYDSKLIVTCQGKSLRTIPNFTNTSIDVDMLDLSTNLITVIESGALVGIRPKAVDLRANPIRLIKEDAFDGIADYVEDIDLSNTQLSIIPTAALGKLQNLTHLRLTIYNLQTIQQLAFPPLPRLTTLDIVGYAVKEVHENAFGNINSTLKVLRLAMSPNHPNKYPLAVRSLSQLQSLQLSQNRFDKIPSEAFKGIFRLKQLSLNANNFSSPDSLSADSFQHVKTSLEYLNLYDTRLVSIPVDALKGLKALKLLNLGANYIQTINRGDLSGLDSLEDLRLSQTKRPLLFQSSSFYGVEDTLRTLSLTQMNLQKVPRDELQQCQALANLFLDKNKITTLPPDAAKGLSVSYYSLVANGLTNISSTAFPANIPISLELSKNKIENVDFITNPCSFRSVKLFGNPLDCNCRLFKLVYRQYGGVTFYGKCKTPAEYDGWSILDASKADEMSSSCVVNMTFQQCEKMMVASSETPAIDYFVIVPWAVAMIFQIIGK